MAESEGTKEIVSLAGIYVVTVEMIVVRDENVGQ